MNFKTYSKKILKAIFPIVPSISIRIYILKLSGYRLGKNVYVPSSLRISDLKTRRNNVFFGDRVSIGPNVLIVTDSSPNNSKLIKIFPMKSEDVIIEKDTWIGSNVTILPGVSIGKCSVIGSGSVVTKNIPEYSIAVGIPAKVVKKISPDEL